MKRPVLPVLLLAGCVSRDTAVGYAQRAHPECSDHSALNHNYTEAGSQTEVQMVCESQKKSITVKCIHGFGIFSDTTCHENN
jgi:hypothetical protein